MAIDTPTMLIPALQKPRSDAPPRYRGLTLNQYNPKTPSQRAAKEAVERLVVEIVRGASASMALIGPPGVGKSHLCAAAVNAIIDGLHEAWLDGARQSLADHEQRMERWRERGSIYNDRPSLSIKRPDYPTWVNVPDLTAALKDEMHERPRDDGAVIRVNMEGLRDHRGLVVLDDLGRERISEWTGETIYRLINHRYEHFLPTMATTNLDAEALSAAGYWPSISRLTSDGGVYVIEGKDGRPL